MQDSERRKRVQDVLRENKWDLLICALPKNVLLLSGYWPVVGSGVAMASSDGKIALLVPQDEEDLAKTGWADDIASFKPASLDKIITTAEAIQPHLANAIRSFSSGPLRIAYESGETSEPASYAAMHLYSGQMQSLLREASPSATLAAADHVLAGMRSKKTDFELNQLRTACQIAEKAFTHGMQTIRVGATEVEIAAQFRQPLSTCLAEFQQLRRADGFAWCMSGPNSALASGAYARSRTRRIENGDLVLVHMNSYADGYWTDVTRTYMVGQPDDQQREMYSAIDAARQAALQAIRPGVKGSEVDAAARDLLKARGFARQFKHSTGHGVGFSAIDANAKPRLHPKSEDILETGMVFNVEPAIYFDGFGGMRHCDMVAVTKSGFEVLTAFQPDASSLEITHPQE